MWSASRVFVRSFGGSVRTVFRVMHKDEDLGAQPILLQAYPMKERGGGGSKQASAVWATTRGGAGTVAAGWYRILCV